MQKSAKSTAKEPSDRLLSKFEMEFLARTFAAREQKGLTQAEMGDKLGGFSQDHYKQFEIRNRMPYEMLPKFVEITGVSYEYLLEGKGDGPPWHERYHVLRQRQDEKLPAA